MLSKEAIIGQLFKKKPNVAQVISEPKRKPWSVQKR